MPFIILAVGIIGAIFAQWIGRRWIISEETLVNQTHDLGERVKELNGLYDISKLLENPDISIEETFQGIVEILPASWQYPEITCARIVVTDKEYKTKNFRETIWKQTQDVLVHGDTVGFVEVSCLEQKPEIDEGPFLREKRHLLDEIADRLRLVIERKQVGEVLKKSENRFREILEQSPFGIALIGSLTGHIYELNPKFTEITGRTIEEMKNTA